MMLEPAADMPEMPEVLRTDPALSSPVADTVPFLLPVETAKPAEVQPSPAGVKLPAVSPQAAPAKPYTAGQLSSADVYDESRLPKGH